MTKRIFYTLIVFAFSFGTQAQGSSVELIYGNTVFQKDFLGQLNSAGNHTFGDPMQFAGASLSTLFVVNGKGRYLDAHLMAAQYVPQRFQANDSVTGKISGSLFGVSAGYPFFRKAERFDLNIAGGLNFGRLKLVDNNFLHLKNGLITPKAAVMVKVYFGKISLVLSAEYVYDISSSGWKEKSGASKRSASVPVPGFNQTGFNFFVGLGWNSDVD